MNAKSLLAYPAFMQSWFAKLAATTGNQMVMVAVGWQMYELTGSAWDLGLVGLLQFLPALLLTLVAGHAADRYHRGHILAACMVAFAIVTAFLTWAAHGEWANRNLLLAASVALGTIKAFQMPAGQSIVPLLVPASVLPRALAFGSAGLQGAIIVGPAIGGFLYVAGAHAVYGTCVALFVLAFVLQVRLRYDHVAPPKEVVTWGTVLAGFGFIWRRKVLLGAVSLDLFAVLLGGAIALLPIFVKDVLGVGPWALGLLRASPAVGALIMSVVLSRWPVTRNVGKLMFAAVAVYGLATIAFALSTVLTVSMVALCIAGAADMVNVVIRQTLVQLDTPNEMRGRVSAVNSIFIGASNQLGEFESGAAAALLGPVGSVLLGGIGTLAIAALWMRLFPDLLHRDSLVKPQDPT